MSSMDDRLNAAGRETGSAFERMAPLAVDVPRSWSRAVTFAMGVSAVVLLIAVPAVLWGGETVPFGGPGGPETPGVASTPDPTTSTTAETPSTTMAPAPVLACGFQLPFSVELPDDFDGPVDGASSDSGKPLEDSQLGVHWTGRQGSVEIRWPTDIAYRGEDVEATGTPESVSFILIGTSEGPQVFADNPHGFPDAEPGTLEGDWAENDCHVAQLMVYGPEGEPGGSVGVVGDPQSDSLVLRLAPTLSRWSELVVDSRTVDVVPDVIPCQGTPDEPTLSDTITEPIVYPTAAEALRAYVETRDHWPDVGYFEFIEPDGTITYGRPFEPDPMTAPTPDDGLVIAVSVVPRGDGWAVDAWESSGC